MAHSEGSSLKERVLLATAVGILQGWDRVWLAKRLQNAGCWLVR
ncbi:hypothetical protein Pla22_39240 [Rubripirellula amarantea]|uniref:Uncharacterized protein n=1 Tax=Rubripirellula amarantea TaxID=2527999 RepID=A0A5C5WKK9_9BACT|nr:hypothetical protein Pla22_39240 [Rubripirellula amarantea]